jgi:hypothetical protein
MDAAPFRPYDLRQSFVSLLLAEGADVMVEAACQAGHSPTMTMSTCAHLFDKREGGEQVGRTVDPTRAATHHPSATYPIRTPVGAPDTRKDLQIP